jgi:arginase family enzyme
MSNTPLNEQTEALLQRIARAEAVIVMLTADHNTSPNYVRGFDMARDYFQDYPTP